MEQKPQETRAFLDVKLRTQNRFAGTRIREWQERTVCRSDSFSTAGELSQKRVVGRACQYLLDYRLDEGRRDE